MKLKRPSLLSKGSLQRTFQAVNEAWKQCDFPAAIEMMERASRLNPSNLDILLNLGRLHGMRYNYAAAEACFERALRIAPKKSDMLMAAGRHSRDFNNFTMADNYFKRALEEKNVPPSALVETANFYERLRRSDQAASLVDCVLQSNASCAPALLLRAKLNRQKGQLDTAEQILRALPRNAELAVRVGAAYELGGIFDRQGRYDEAMSAFLTAKAMLQPHAQRSIIELKVMRARIDYLTANAPTDLLKQWFNSSGQFPPPQGLALLGGHPRSGTTLLEQVLDSHPGIVSAEETEIFYNDAYAPLLRDQPDDAGMFTGLAAATAGQLQQSRQNYFRSMELSLGQPIGGRLLIDKNPSYTFLIPALIRIFPEIKLLIALRDPRDVVMSCFMQNLPLNQTGTAFLSLECTITEYGSLMRTWQTVAARTANPFLEVRYEDMVENLESVARQTLDFLGVNWDARVLGFDEHARNKTVRSPTYADVTQPVYKRAVGRWRHYQKYLEPHLKNLEPFVKAFGYE
jgi:tetratricopeptide (TPR) repeat protein